MSSNSANSETQPRPQHPARSGRAFRTGAAVAILALGAIGGAGAAHLVEKSQAQSVLLLQPTPIAQMKDANPVAVKGEVAEIYGNKFIVQDGSGRTLVDSGPAGDSGTLVAKGETVTVQGDFDGGFIRAVALTRADGSVETFGRPPHPGPGKASRPGPRAECGPADNPPAPPPPAPAP